MIPVKIPPQPDQDIEQNIPVLPTRRETNLIEIPQLESDLEEEEEQFEDLQMYLTHHNTYQESQNICKEYRKRLLDLEDNRYYQEIDRAYETYGPTRDYIPVNQVPGPHRMTQELIQTFSRGRGQACREQNIPVLPTRRETNLIEIPQLESDLEEEEEQFKDLQMYLTHHNTYQESQNIRKEYRKRLLDLDDNRYYQEIDRAYETYGPTRDYIPVNQVPGPHRTTQELIQTFDRGRGQACREGLHRH